MICRIWNEHLKIIVECSLKNQYKSPQITDNNNTICKLRRNVYMKATGIVRRIEACGIIGQKLSKYA
jgi:hypothetical protein